MDVFYHTHFLLILLVTYILALFVARLQLKFD